MSSVVDTYYKELLPLCGFLLCCCTEHWIFMTRLISCSTLPEKWGLELLVISVGDGSSIGEGELDTSEAYLTGSLSRILPSPQQFGDSPFPFLGFRSWIHR